MAWKRYERRAALATRWVCAPRRIFACPVKRWWLITLLVSICLGSNQRVAVNSWPTLPGNILLCMSVCMHGSEDYDLSFMSVWAVLLFITTETTRHLQSYNHLQLLLQHAASLVDWKAREKLAKIHVFNFSDSLSSPITYTDLSPTHRVFHLCCFYLSSIICFHLHLVVWQQPADFSMASNSIYYLVLFFNQWIAEALHTQGHSDNGLQSTTLQRCVLLSFCSAYLCIWQRVIIPTFEVVIGLSI